jgi:hypothetical protein
MSMMGELTPFLGCKEFDMGEAKPLSMPMSTTTELHIDEDDVPTD